LRQAVKILGLLRGPVWQKIAAYVQKTGSLEQIVQEVKKQLPA
jgi:cytochrome c551/c552